jgi:hypothetical protein
MGFIPFSKFKNIFTNDKVTVLSKSNKTRKKNELGQKLSNFNLIYTF